MNLRTLAGACALLCAFAPAGLAAGAQYVAVKGADWALELDLNSFGLEPAEDADYDHDVNHRLKTGMSEDGLLLTVFIERLPKAYEEKIKTGVGCRNFYWESLKKFPVPAADTKRMEYRGMALLQRDFEDVKENGVFMQRSVHAYLFRSPYCVDLHISKTNYQAGDAALLNKFINRVRLVNDYKPAPGAPVTPEEAAPQGEAADGGKALEAELNSGIMAHMSGDYKTAAEKLGRVLESEKKQRTLTDRMLIPVIDNLGISYGQLGNFQKSQETLDYGLQLFPTHTPFNYNKACGYAEAGDLDSALAQLDKAYANNPKLKPYLPNPARDSSFAKFRKDPKFKQFLKRNDK